MSFQTSALCLFVLFSAISAAFGSRGHQVTQALLKQNLYKSALRECGYNDKNLVNGVKELLIHVAESELEERQPQPQYLDALTKAFCLSHNFNKAVATVSVADFSDSDLLVGASTGSFEQGPGSVEDSENYSNNSEEHVETESYSAGDMLVFFFGLVIGFIICHYFFLINNSPSIGTTKVLRRPEL